MRVLLVSFAAKSMADCVWKTRKWNTSYKNELDTPFFNSSAIV